MSPPDDCDCEPSRRKAEANAANPATHHHLSVALSDGDHAQLARLENRVRQGLASFVEVGKALAEIRDSRLYRATHATFEDYCRDKWKMSRPRAYELMGAADVVSAITDKSAITTASQARELAKVDPARRDEVVASAIEATGGKITAGAIARARVSPAAVLAGEKAEEDSEKLWRFKSLWNRLGKKDRAAFTTWLQSQPATRRARP